MRLFLNEKKDFLALLMFFKQTLSDQMCCAIGIATDVKGTQKIFHEYINNENLLVNHEIHFGNIAQQPF